MFDEDKDGRLNTPERTAAERFWNQDNSRPTAKSVGRRMA